MSVEQRDLEGGVRILTLHNPPANVFNQALREDLRTACEAAAADNQVRAVIVTGSGRFFSGGLDLNAVGAGSPDGVFGMDFGRNDGAFALWTLPKPTIAMVNGHAVAGGGIVCLACDLRIAARTQLKIGLNEVAIGLSFPTGAYEIAAAALGVPALRRVLLEAALYDVDTAQRLGMIDEVVEPADLERVCLARARLLGSYRPAAYAHTKRTLQGTAVDRVRHESAEQRAITKDIWASPEAMEIIKSQLTRLSKSA